MTRDSIERGARDGRWSQATGEEILALYDRAVAAEAGSYADIAELGRVLVALKFAGINAEWVEGEMLTKTSPAEGVEKLTAERDLATAQLVDVTRQRDECAAALRRWETVLAPWWDATRAEPSAPEQVAAALLAMREALLELMGKHGAPWPEKVHAILANPSAAGAAWSAEQKAAAVRDNALDVHVELVDLFDGNSEDPRLIEALAEHDAKVRAEGYEACRQYIESDAAEETTATHDARVAAEARRAALAPLGQAFEAVKTRGWTWIDDRKKDLGDRLWDLAKSVADPHATVPSAALAPPSPAPSGDEDPCDCDHESDEEHGANCCFWGTPPAAKAEPEPQCTGTLVHDAYSICPVHDAKPVCARCGGWGWFNDPAKPVDQRHTLCDCAVPR